jgi:hypothetical protein
MFSIGDCSVDRFVIDYRFLNAFRSVAFMKAIYFRLELAVRRLINLKSLQVCGTVSRCCVSRAPSVDVEIRLALNAAWLERVIILQLPRVACITGPTANPLSIGVVRDGSTGARVSERLPVTVMLVP